MLHHGGSAETLSLCQIKAATSILNHKERELIVRLDFAVAVCESSPSRLVTSSSGDRDLCAFWRRMFSSCSCSDHLTKEMLRWTELPRMCPCPHLQPSHCFTSVIPESAFASFIGCSWLWLSVLLMRLNDYGLPPPFPLVFKC